MKFKDLLEKKEDDNICESCGCEMEDCECEEIEETTATGGSTSQAELDKKRRESAIRQRTPEAREKSRENKRKYARSSEKTKRAIGARMNKNKDLAAKNKSAGVRSRDSR